MGAVSCPIGSCYSSGGGGRVHYFSLVVFPSIRHHPVQSWPDHLKSRAIAVSIHGDEGVGKKNREIMILSWSSLAIHDIALHSKHLFAVPCPDLYVLNVFRTQPRVWNLYRLIFPGDKTHYLKSLERNLRCILKPQVIKSDAFAFEKESGKNITLAQLQRHMVHSFNKLSNPMPEYDNWTCHITCGKGDWKFRRDWLQQSRHWSNLGPYNPVNPPANHGQICSRCLCNNTDLPWLDATEKFNRPEDLAIAKLTRYLVHPSIPSKTLP